jgi:anti-anti-sigma regulatory factor
MKRAKEHSVPVTLEQNDTVSVIRLEGAVDIGSACELKTLLVQALEQGEDGAGKEVRVALAGTTDLDVTALQLLWAAERKARAAAVAFALEGGLPEPVRSAMTHAGFQSFFTSGDAR